MKSVKKILPICMMATIGTTIAPVVTSCNNPNVPIGGPEAYIMDNGVKHEITSLIDSHICDETATRDIVCDDGKTYRRADFNLPLTLNDNLTKIDDNFLNDCEMFNQTITLPKSLKTIGFNFMTRCLSFNKELIVPNNVTHIGDYFMNSCALFNNSLILPSSLTTIGECFLLNCPSFNQKLVLPNGLIEIGDHFMFRADSFEQILTIPKTVEKIDGSILEDKVVPNLVKFAPDSHLKSFPLFYNNEIYDLTGSSLEYKENILYNHYTKAAL
ncbi:MAG: leucine-rich repeat domain-containing protein [Mycoplasmoidaceae bacterium]|nr:leucine-rich repeat domain-containing protein [Mycoplasmoidaceae bacterium]